MMGSMTTHGPNVRESREEVVFRGKDMSGREELSNHFSMSKWTLPSVWHKYLQSIFLEDYEHKMDQYFNEWINESFQFMNSYYYFTFKPLLYSLMKIVLKLKSS